MGGNGGKIRRYSLILDGIFRKTSMNNMSHWFLSPHYALTSAMDGSNIRNS